ncbi:MAG TPA: VCBS repeat-containing protein [Planctomycetota bacterium]|nr:VCBS repeat-containing protein [Planctomycetota bacterium]
MRALAALLALLQDPAFETRTLETGGRADRIVARDLDGDGRDDLVVQNGRDLHVFLQDPRRGFPDQPLQVLRLEPTAFLWTLAALDGRPALLTAGSRAVQGRPFGPGGFRAEPADLAVHPSLFEGTLAEGRAPLFLDFAPDLDRDGRPDLVLFLKDALLLLKQHPGGEFRALQKVPFPVETAIAVPWAPHQKLTEITTVPVLALGDLDGDGRPDLVTSRDEALIACLQGPDGRYLPPRSFDLAAERRRRRVRLLQFEVPPRLGDFNGDGLLDVVLVYPSKGRVHAYYGRAGRTDFTQPDDVFHVGDGWSTGVYLEDLDRDGRPDLVMGVIRKFGVTEGVQVFLSGRVDLELHVFPMTPAGRFSKDPVQELRFSIPFSFQLTRESIELDLVFRPNFQGDFNRDGRRDLLVAEDARTLRLYPGVPERFLADAPAGAVTLNPPPETSLTEPFVADLNGDGVSDLILRHTLSVRPPRHALELKLSR